MNNEEILFSLLRLAICGGTVSEEVKACLCEERVTQIFALAKKHDLTHIAADALNKLGLLGDSEISRKFKHVSRHTVYRYMQIDSEYQKLCKTLEEARIPFVPLKGSVLRDYYPEPWMRTSCDIDILVKVDVLESTAKLLVDKLGYVRQKRSDHDIALLAPNGVPLELHYLAVDEGRMPAAQAILQKVWDDVTPKAAGSYHYCMSDELFYFYHVVHMAKHVENGGCGIRPFLDLWILNHCIDSNRAVREKLLVEGEFLTFAQAAEKLSEVWFSDGQRDARSDRLERFVLDGGVYGTMENHIAVQQTQRGGKLQYVLWKVFLPYDRLKFHYPILQKHRWLTPLFEVRRWIKLIFTQDVKRSLRTLETNADIASEQMEEMAELLKSLGLQ